VGVAKDKVMLGSLQRQKFVDAIMVSLMLDN
jgi:hypothetical protein